MPEDDEIAPSGLAEEEHQTPTVDEEDAESEEEQTWENEYEDREGQSTLPSHKGPGVKMQRFRCAVCGHVVERQITGTAYDDLPPVHHNRYMSSVGEEEARLPMEAFLERLKERERRKADKASKKTAGKGARKAAGKGGAGKKAGKRAAAKLKPKTAKKPKKPKAKKRR